MKRQLERFERETFDLAIIGAGIYGASLAWEAAGRGLSVALLEKGDFTHATSANSMKVIHGGFRYLQHADFRRIRESVRERRALMQIAPHLIHPLPVLVPTYGHGLKGRETLTAALAAYDLLSQDRNRLGDPQKHIPNGRMLSVQECLERAPGIEQKGLTGGALFYDALAQNSERLSLAYLHAADRAGAALANYARVSGFLVSEGRVNGVKVHDQVSGDDFEVRARLVINTAGPWIDEVVGLLPGPHAARGLVKAVNVVTRQIFAGQALGLRGDNGYDDGSGLRRSDSFLFIVPWRGRSMLGTLYQPYSSSPDDLSISQADVQAVIEAVNAAYPPSGLVPEDAAFVHAGLLPRQPGRDAGTVAQHYTIHDYASSGFAGLLSVTGVKYTTARDVAQKTVDRAFHELDRPVKASISAHTRLPGGEIELFDVFLAYAVSASPCGLGPESMRSLVYTYGSDYPRVLHYFPTPDERAGASGEAALWTAQVRYAVREEMAYSLSDVIFRRTDLGTAGHPGSQALSLCATVMAQELGWSPERTEAEIAEVEQRFRWSRD